MPELDPDTLETLSCAIGQRPADAPAFSDLAPAVRTLRREPGTLVVDFAPEALAAVQALVAAERLCCSTLTWRLEHDRGLTLHIGASHLQLDTLEQLFQLA